MKYKRILAGLLSAALVLTGHAAGATAFAVEAPITETSVIDSLPGTERTFSSYNSSFLSVTGFAKGYVNDRTWVLEPENSSAYRIANNEEEFLQALDDAAEGIVSAIEITSDLELGWNTLTEKEKSFNSISKYGWDITVDITNPSIRETDVSQVTISNTHGLTIFSRAGVTVNHAEWKLQGSSSDIVIRNLKFDGMWHWSDAASSHEAGWTLLKLNGVKGVWIDHCSFTIAADGNMDSENGASNMTTSWCTYSLPATETPGTDSMIYKTIMYLEEHYQEGLLGENDRYVLLRNGGASPEQIMAYSAIHPSLCMNGSGDKDFKDGAGLEDGNQRLHLTLAYNKGTSVGSRFPLVRQGTAHLLNCYIDNSGHMGLHNDPALPFGKYGNYGLNRGMDARNGACIGADTCVFKETVPMVGSERQNQNFNNMASDFAYAFANVYNHTLAVNSKVTNGDKEYIGSSWDNNGENLFTQGYTWVDKSTIGHFAWYSSIKNADQYTRGVAPKDENGNPIQFEFEYSDEPLPYSYQAIPLDEVEETIDTYAGAYVFREGPEFWLRTEYAADETIVPADQSETILTEDVEIIRDSMEINLGEFRQLDAWVEPSHASCKEVVWTSSDTSVLEVRDSGLLVPKKAGTAVVTVSTKDGTNIAKTCLVTVTNPVTSIRVTNAPSKIYLGDENNPPESVQLAAEVLPEDATNKEVKWSSSNNRVLTVDEDGVLTPLATGNVRITCSSVSNPEISTVVRITVKAGVNPDPPASESPEPPESAEPSETPGASETPGMSESPEPSETPVIYGDVNLDGDITADDALDVLKCIVKLKTLSEIQIKAADVNKDEVVDISDALYILQKVVKLLEYFPAETAK